MNKAVLWIIAIAIVLAGGFFLLRNSSSVSQTGPIELGFIGPLTGDAAAVGADVQAGVEVAVDEINGAGGVNGRQLHVTYEDGQCAAAPATNAAQKLISENHVVAIIGGLCSTETAAFGPIAMQDQVPIISPGSSAPNLSQLGAFFFRDYPSDAYQGKFAADYLYNNLHARKVAVLYHISDYGTGIKNVFEQEFKLLGGQIVDEEGADQTATDYRAQLTKIKTAKPDYIYTPMYPAGATAMFKQAKQLGIAIPFFGGDALSDTKLHTDVKDLGLSIMFSQLKSNLPADFNSKIEAKTHGTQVLVYAATAYDAVHILANALKSASGGEQLANEIRSTSHDGVSGHIAFDQHGDIAASGYDVYKIANGTATIVQQ